MSGVAVVTGSASGIGHAAAERLEREGFRIVGVDLREAEVVADLSTSGGRDAAIAGVREQAGDGIDRLVVAAGVGGVTKPASLVARVNYHGAVAMLDGLLPLLTEGSDPAAVVVGSNSAGLAPADDPLVSLLLDGDEEAAAVQADASHGELVYMCSKLALARAARRRTAGFAEAGVRLNVVAPGPVRTPLLDKQLADPEVGPAVEAFPVPLGRWSTPEEIAGVIAWLLGPQAAFVHGSILVADGGTDALVRPDNV